MSRRVKITVAHNINLGNYESVRGELTLEGDAVELDLPETATYAEIFDKLYKDFNPAMASLLTKEVARAEVRRQQTS